MKIRKGFVSNSSSCNFIVESQARVNLPSFDGEQMNLVSDFLPDIDFGISSNSYTSGYLRDDDDCEEKHVTISRVAGYKEGTEMNPMTIVTINLKKETNQKDQIDLIEETTRIFNAVINCMFKDDEGDVSLKGDEGILYFSQTAKSTGDGGWDGGDPSGDYHWSRDLMREQTKTGTIILKGRGITIDIIAPFEEK